MLYVMHSFKNQGKGFMAPVYLKTKNKKSVFVRVCPWLKLKK